MSASNWPLPEPTAYLTLDDEGSPSMLFFDVVEARTYCELDEEPVRLFTEAQVLDLIDALKRAAAKAT